MNEALVTKTNIEFLKKQAIKSIEEVVISGEKDSAKLYCISPGDISKHLIDTLGCTGGEDLDSNGWQMDFWESFYLNDQKFVMSGSAYYNDHVTLSKEKS